MEVRDGYTSLHFADDFFLDRFSNASTHGLPPFFRSLSQTLVLFYGVPIIEQDWSGAIVEISDEYDFTYLRFAKDFVTRKWH